MITVKAGMAWIVAFCVTLAVGGLLIHPLVAVVFGIMGLPATGTCVSMMYDNRLRTTRNSPRMMQSEETSSNEESEKAEDEQPENDEVEDPRLRGLFEE